MTSNTRRHSLDSGCFDKKQSTAEKLHLEAEPNLNIFETDKTYIITFEESKTYEATYFLMSDLKDLELEKECRQHKNYFKVYYWVGENSSKESRMIAVRKALQTMQNYQNFNMKLSPYNIPITRIMEGYESCDRHFKTVFHVQRNCPEFPKLFKVKGATYVHVMKVPVSFDQLNHDDCFVLHRGEEIITSCGNTANKNEKNKADVLTLYIRNADHNLNIPIRKLDMLEHLNEILGGTLDSTIREKDEISDTDFEIKRYLYISIEEFQIHPLTNYVNKRTLKTSNKTLKSTRTNENIRTEDVPLKFKELDEENTYIVYENLKDKIFIYFGRSSLHRNIEATFKEGEILAEHNVEIIQTCNAIPTEFVILFPDLVKNLINDKKLSFLVLGH